jgi:hypothetical protein
MARPAAEIEPGLGDQLHQPRLAGPQRTVLAEVDAQIEHGSRQ